MKLTAFDRLFSARVSTGTTNLGYSSGSNSASGDTSGGSDVIGTPGNYTVVSLRDRVALASNMGDNTVGSVLTTIQSSPWLATFAMPSNSGAVDAVNVAARTDVSGASSENVQGQLDELYEAVGWTVASVGSITAGGSPGTIVNDSSHNNFPGLGRLNAGRVLVVYRKGTDHLTGGKYVGRILTLASDHASISAVGNEFDIYDHATLDVRGEDMVFVDLDGSVYVSGRHHNGSANVQPFVLRCDDLAKDLSSSSTWTKHDVTLTEGDLQNYMQGHLHRLGDGTYIHAVGWQDAASDHVVGALKVTDPTDWSAPTVVTIGSGATDYAEISLLVMPDGTTVRAHVRPTTDTNHHKAVSADSGATFGALSSVFTAEGYPMFRRLLSGQLLTVYRATANSDNAWRTDANDDDASWSSQTILDTTGTRSAYASAQQLTPNVVLVAYAVEYSADGSTGGGDIFYQLFADASTFTAGGGTGGTPATTVESETTFGITPAVGTDTEYARQDHTHGTPSSATLTGEILITDTPAGAPLVFADLIQNEAQDDLVYADI